MSEPAAPLTTRTAGSKRVTLRVRPMARSSTSIPNLRSEADGNARFRSRAAWWIVAAICVISHGL
jgi:hypothetical protein